MRSLIRGLIIADSELMGLIPAERWVSGGSLTAENAPARPFAVIRFGVTGVGMAHIHRMSATIWIHDDPGSYGQIDDIIFRLNAILDGVEQVSDGAGNELMRCSWESNSGDLYDPGFRTITRNSTFAIVGKGA